MLKQMLRRKLKNMIMYDVTLLTLTFPLMLDMILYIEVDGDVSSNASWPALSDVGLGNLYYGKRGDRLSHPSPSSKYHSAIL